MSLPPRGTGLRTGRAGNRRFGKPRSDAERYARHYGANLSSLDGSLYTIGAVSIIAGILLIVAGKLKS